MRTLQFSSAPPQVVALPATTNENNKDWQENVLRNAALAASIHAVARPGRHTLKLWIVDPGVVVDTIFAGNCVAPVAGYVGGAETLNQSR